MNILMLLSNAVEYDSRVKYEAQSLTNAGHFVKILCWDRDGDFKFADKYSGSLLEPYGIVNNYQSRFHPFQNPLSMYLKALKLPKWFKADVIHCHDLDTLMTGILLKHRHKKAKIIYDTHEIYEYMHKGGYYPDVLVKQFKTYEKVLMKFMDYQIVIDEPYYEYYRDKHFKPIVTITHAKHKPENLEVNTDNSKKLKMLYVGTIKNKRLFPDIITYLGDFPYVEVKIAGKENNVKKETIKAAARYENVEYLGKVTEEEKDKLEKWSNCFFAFLNPTFKHYQVNLLNKHFEAMAKGKLFLTNSGTYTGKLVAETSSGFCCEYNKDSILTAVKFLAQHPTTRHIMGYNAKVAAISHWNWGTFEKRLLNLYEVIENDI